MNAMHVPPPRKGHFWAIGIIAPLLLSGSASAEIWCRRDFDRNNPVCVFSSAQDCVRAAGAMGGVCEREQLAPARTAKPCKPSREARAAPKRRSADSGCDAS